MSVPESAALSVPGLVPVFPAVPSVLFPLASLLPVVPLPLSVQMPVDFPFLMTPPKPAMILYWMPMFLMTALVSGQALVPAAKLLAKWAAVPASLSALSAASSPDFLFLLVFFPG